MPKGRSLHIGLNAVDPTHYQDEHGDPWQGVLEGCERDASDMYELAVTVGFASSTLLTASASSAAVLEAIEDASVETESGDIFLLTFSGHGGQIEDKTGDETDSRDETWVLYDRELIDDEIFLCLSKFKAGARVVVVSDSCHSGTVVRLMPEHLVLGSARATTREAGRPKRLPAGVQLWENREYGAMYEQIQRETPNSTDVDLSASVLLLAGCSDGQSSRDGPINGVFTGALLKVWSDGRFEGAYDDFHKAIRAAMPDLDTQNPELFWPRQEDPSFAGQKPFTI